MVQRERSERVQNVCQACRGKNTQECRELVPQGSIKPRYFDQILVDDQKKVIPLKPIEVWIFCSLPVLAKSNNF